MGFDCTFFFIAHTPKVTICLPRDLWVFYWLFSFYRRDSWLLLSFYRLDDLVLLYIINSIKNHEKDS
jgi:hypothetical protein